MFDHERLDVYRFAVEFDSIVVGLLPKRGNATVRDQLDRASVGIVACIAEGAGRRTPADKRHFYAMARGSAAECVALLDVLRNRHLVNDADHERCRALLLSIVRMLSRLSDP
jgi:four helix bundle protein